MSPIRSHHPTHLASPAAKAIIPLVNAWGLGSGKDLECPMIAFGRIALGAALSADNRKPVVGTARVQVVLDCRGETERRGGLSDAYELALQPSAFLFLWGRKTA